MSGHESPRVAYRFDIVVTVTFYVRTSRSRKGPTGSVSALRTIVKVTSRAPGQMPTPQSLLSEETLLGADDVALAHTMAAIMAVQHRRAIEDGDVDSMLEQAFVDGFSGRGDAYPPWVENGLLFCPGMRRDKSATSHECTFVSVDDSWVWEAPGTIKDVMRQVPGPKTVKQSITILLVTEGAKVDMVESDSRSGGPCQMKRARSFQIRAGQLVEVNTRSRPTSGHR